MFLLKSTSVLTGRKPSIQDSAVKGIITEIDHNTVTVQFMQAPDDASTESRCSSCSLKHSCSLPKLKTIEIAVPNPDEYKITDPVDVDIPAKRMIALSAMVYLLPLALMVSFSLFGYGISEFWGIVFGLFGLLCGLFAPALINRRLTSSNILAIKRC